jgi:hypothetical protein
MTETIVLMKETIVSTTKTIFSTVKTIVWILSQSYAHRGLLLVEESFANLQLVVFGACIIFDSGNSPADAIC